MKHNSKCYNIVSYTNKRSKNVPTNLSMVHILFFVRLISDNDWCHNITCFLYVIISLVVLCCLWRNKWSTHSSLFTILRFPTRTLPLIIFGPNCENDIADLYTDRNTVDQGYFHECISIKLCEITINDIHYLQTISNWFQLLY